jgi:hypothetical protein
MARYIDADKLRERDFGDFGYEMRYEIDRTPTEDVRPVVRGKWIENAPEYQTIDPPYICSECGNPQLRKRPFCDGCGADMREENKND